MWSCLPYNVFSDCRAVFRWNSSFLPLSSLPISSISWSVVLVDKSNSCHLFRTFYVVLRLLFCFLNPMFSLAFLWSQSFFLLLACTALFLKPRLNSENVPFLCLTNQPITVCLFKKISVLLSSLCLQFFSEFRSKDVTAQTQKFSGISKLTTSPEGKRGIWALTRWIWLIFSFL